MIAIIGYRPCALVTGNSKSHSVATVCSASSNILIPDKDVNDNRTSKPGVMIKSELGKEPILINDTLLGLKIKHFGKIEGLLST